MVGLCYGNYLHTIHFLLLFLFTTDFKMRSGGGGTWTEAKVYKQE